MKVIIAGELPFVQEVAKLCLDAGYDTHVFLVEDFLGAIESGYVLDDVGEVDVALELHNESAAAKQELILALDHALPANALLLTSALATSATQAAAWVPMPGRVVGFGMVPPLRKDGGMIELAAGLQTAASSLVQAEKFIEGLGYETAVVGDGPGLVRARTICCLINEAASALFEGVATTADIDQAMKLGTNYPYGPLEWGDYLGLDTVLGVMNGLFSEWGEDRYRPSPLLKRMVLAGKYGRKTGEGFFNYES